jgi:hypothetical protein
MVSIYDFLLCALLCVLSSLLSVSSVILFVFSLSSRSIAMKKREEKEITEDTERRTQRAQRRTFGCAPISYMLGFLSTAGPFGSGLVFVCVYETSWFS